MQEIKYSRLYKEYKTNQLIQQSHLIPTILFIIGGITGATIIPVSSLSFKTDKDMFWAMFMMFWVTVILILALSHLALTLVLPKKYTIICENYSEYKKIRHQQWEEEQKKWLW